MNKTFYLLLVVVHILLFVSFQSMFPFWVMFTGTFLLLSIVAIRNSKLYLDNFSIENTIVAIFSGILMYGLFYIGKVGSAFLFPAQLADVVVLYEKVNPVLSWHFVALFLIIIPGEELFWRGYVQGKIEAKWKNKITVVVISSLLYTSANIYTFNPLFLLATFTGGIVWGTLYIWKKNILLTILSHLVFNLFLLILFPLF
ncbi:CPBP family intramembrane glutamic endopeptidase [Ferdinandcohnia sp. Marseille-Q9671]